MIIDPDLAAAIAGRQHWRVGGDDVAVYEVPGRPAIVRVGRIRRPPLTGPTRHDRYFAALVRDGRATHVVSFGFAAEAIRWAESNQLS